MRTKLRSLKAATAIGVGLASATTANADEATFERYLDIARLFTGGLAASELEDGTYPALIAPNLRGNWAQVQALYGPPADAEALAEEVAGACERFPIIINPVAPYGVVFTRTTPRTEALTITYNYAGGTAFSPHLDTLEAAEYYGLDGPAMEGALMNLLREYQEDLNIYVASEDIVVFAPITGRQQFLVRCPGDDRLGDPDLAIEDILLRSLDGDLRTIRAATSGNYLDCGRGVLKTLERADLAELALALDGGEPATTAYGEVHPELVEQLAACVPTDDG